MGYPRKIVTCCYCGTRAALVLRGRDRHELACSSCGAPLHELKMLPVQRGGDRELVDRPSPAYSSKKKQKKPSKKRKRRTGWLKDVFEEAFDVLEDIFD